MKNQILQGDCLEAMRTIPDNSIDLICTDPPYFKVKADWWDKQWEKPKHFLEWLDSLSEQWQRILRPNGSLYCFASPKMSARVEVMLGERFNVLNRITWQKPPFATKAEMFTKESLRGFFSASESIIFCEHYFEPLRAWFVSQKEKAHLTNYQINVALGTATNGSGMAGHYFKQSGAVQWELPTLEHYTKLQQVFPGYFTRPYEELRRPFNVTADVPYTDVWTFPTVSAYKGKHPCEKPAALLEHIITASTRPGAIVLDCFAGSGSTLAAAQKLGRDFIGIEIDPHWVAIANQRIGNFEAKRPALEERIQWLETQMQAQRNKIKKLEGDRQLSIFDVLNQ